jgi:hypothetical protein
MAGIITDRPVQPYPRHLAHIRVELTTWIPTYCAHYKEVMHLLISVLFKFKREPVGV